VDYDATNNRYYDPVDLNDRRILMQGGLPPSESDPHFHQQMVYAVAMETVQHFEIALGRRIHWRRGERATQTTDQARREDIWVLKLYPHAMEMANAFYSPEAHGILFGYFRASETSPGRNLPGQTVFTCLSHDIIAHETTHAVIDGIRTYFTEPTNVDVPAFHEAFADLVALFRHFSHEGVLLDVIRRTGGRLFDIYLQPLAAAPNRTRAQTNNDRTSEQASNPLIQAQLAERNPLVELARQFGDASGRDSGLRSALGTPPDPRDYLQKQEPHDRGSVLVAAVFDAYFTIYLKRTSSLFRLYRAGGGVSLTGDDVPQPLAELLAAEASRTADRFFRLCVRALDYCPPVDITFGDFLRAIITANSDLEPNEPDGVSDALMQSFRLRGIVPEDASFFSEDALRWPSVPVGTLPAVEGLYFGDPNGLTRREADRVGRTLRAYAKRNAASLGFDSAIPIEVPSFHPMFRTGPTGRLLVDMVVEMVQTRHMMFDQSNPGFGQFPFRGGATLIISKPRPQPGEDLPPASIRHVIAKHLHGSQGSLRAARQRKFYHGSGYLQGDQSGQRRFQINFALLHAGL
jgi:hypothetical protein